MVSALSREKHREPGATIAKSGTAILSCSSLTAGDQEEGREPDRPVRCRLLTVPLLLLTG